MLLRHLRTRRWDARFDRLFGKVKKIEAAAESGMRVSTPRTKVLALRYLIADEYLWVDDSTAFEDIALWLRSVPSVLIDHAYNDARDRVERLRRAGLVDWGMATLLLAFALEGEILRREARDELRKALADGCIAGSLLVLYPDARWKRPQPALTPAN